MERMNGREVVGYLRVSTELQGLQGLGIAAQREAVLRFAAAYGCDVVAEYAEVETGRKEHLRNRPQLVLAVAHAKRSGALLVIARLDRLARNVLVTSQLLESGVDFVAADNPHANRLTIHILAAMAEYEGRIISERTKAGLAALKARGGTIRRGAGGLSPEARKKGQAAAKIAHRRRASEAYADLVPTIRGLREAGKSLREIAEHLNLAGHRNQRQNRWNTSNVRGVLIREGLEHLTDIGIAPPRMTPEIQRRGAVAAGIALRARARAAYAHIAPLVRERFEAGETLNSIAAWLNAEGHKTQGWGRFRGPDVRRMLVNDGRGEPARLASGFQPAFQTIATAAAIRANREKAERLRSRHLPLALALRSEGLTLVQLAQEFNRRRRKTPRGRRWSSNAIWVLLHSSRIGPEDVSQVETPLTDLAMPMLSVSESAEI